MMNQPYLRVRFRLFSTGQFERIKKQRSYRKCLGSKKNVRTMMQQKQIEPTLTKE